MSKDTASIRDQLGNDSETFTYLDYDYYEDIDVGGPTEISELDYSSISDNVFLVGDINRGRLGLNKLTYDTEYSPTKTVLRVINANNKFIDTFNDTDYVDLTETTATINDGEVDFSE